MGKEGTPKTFGLPVVVWPNAILSIGSFFSRSNTQNYSITKVRNQELLIFHLLDYPVGAIIRQVNIGGKCVLLFFYVGFYRYIKVKTITC
jgi:hypothetical protein